MHLLSKQILRNRRGISLCHQLARSDVKVTAVYVDGSLVASAKAGDDAIKLAATTKEGLDKAIDEMDAMAVNANAIYSQRENIFVRA